MRRIVSIVRGAAQVVVTKIHFMNNIHFCVFRNVQKEKKDVTVFSSVFSELRTGHIMTHLIIADMSVSCWNSLSL